MNVKLRSLVVAQALLATAMIALGCKPEVLPNSGNHPPLMMSQVKIYQTPPKKYEELGNISIPITPEMRFDERGDSTPGYDALLTKAAALGANGVLLEDKTGTQTGAVTVGYKGKFYTVPLTNNPRTAVAQAIYVLKEK